MHRRLASMGGFAAVIAIVWLALVPVAGQAPSAAAKATQRTSAAAKPWTAPRAPDGHPDLQGVWTNATPTPLERPAELGGKEFFTEQEAAAGGGGEDRRNQAHTRADEYVAVAVRKIPVADTNPWNEPGKLLLRTSLIVDPPDGKMPPLTPEAQKREAAREEAASRRGAADSWEDRNTSERCISRGAPKLPGIYNANFQIWQTSGYVAILQEMIHEVRIIPLDGRPHVDKSVHLWLGDSVGHWEGNTLVVDTTNYNDKISGNIYNCCGVAGTDLHVVERFTRVDADTIDYRYTVDAPATYTKPYTAAVPMKKAEGPIFEYACHEGNYSMLHILSEARNQEKAAAAKKGSK